MVIANDIILPFTSSNALIPAGWVRDTSFDSKYIFGCSETDSGGGDTGGASSHSHDIPLDHYHNFYTDSPTPMSIVYDKEVKPPVASDRHGHNSITSYGASFEDDPPIQFGSNDPLNFIVIFCKSQSATQINSGFLAWNDTKTLLSGFEWADGSGVLKNNLMRRYLKGAATGLNGGYYSGNSTHTHLSEHSHLSKSSDICNDTFAGEYNEGRDTADPSHTHAVQLNSYTSTTLSGNNSPTFTSLGLMYAVNDTPLQVNTIAIWKGLKSNIPAGWIEVTSVRDKFILGNDNLDSYPITGGNSTHYHTHSHTHSVSYSYEGGSGESKGENQVADIGHEHSWVVQNVNIISSYSTSLSSYPPYIKVVFIKYVGGEDYRYTLLESSNNLITIDKGLKELLIIK